MDLVAPSVEVREGRFWSPLAILILQPYNYAMGKEVIRLVLLKISIFGCYSGTVIWHHKPIFRVENTIFQ